jgi:hypothetical protein
MPGHKGNCIGTQYQLLAEIFSDKKIFKKALQYVGLFILLIFLTSQQMRHV